MSKNCFISHTYKYTEHKWSLLLRHRSCSKASVVFIGFIKSSFWNISRWRPRQFRNCILLHPALQRTLHRLCHLMMGYGTRTSHWTSCIHTAQCSDQCMKSSTASSLVVLMSVYSLCRCRNAAVTHL